MRKAGLKLGVAFAAGIACAVYMAKLPSGPTGDQDWAAAQHPSVSATASAPATASAARHDAPPLSPEAKLQNALTQKSAAVQPKPAPQPKVAAQPAQPAPAPQPKIVAQSPPPAPVAPPVVATQPPQPAPQPKVAAQAAPQPKPAVAEPVTVAAPPPKPAIVEQAAAATPAATQPPLPVRAETNGSAAREPDAASEHKVVSASREAKAEPAALTPNASASEPMHGATSDVKSNEAKRAIADTPPAADVAAARGDSTAADRKSVDRRTREARDGDSDKRKARRTAQRGPSGPRSLQADNEAEGFNLVHSYRLQDGRRVTVYRRYDEGTTAMAYERPRPRLFFSLPGFDSDY